MFENPGTADIQLQNPTSNNKRWNWIYKLEVNKVKTCQVFVRASDFNNSDRST